MALSILWSLQAPALGPLVFGPLGSPPAILVGLALLAVIVLVGRVVLAVAWRLVIIALLALTVLWVLAGLGIETGIF